MEPIRNKVKESGLIPMDLAELLPPVDLRTIDLSSQLWQGLVLREKEFRAWIKANDWQAFRGTYVRIFCSTDAIIPTWAYMLVSAALQPFTSDVVAGDTLAMEHYRINKALAALNKEELRDQTVIVKGCTALEDQEYALSRLVMELKPYVKSLMFGEPCSTVPIFKRARL